MKKHFKEYRTTYLFLGLFLIVGLGLLLTDYILIDEESKSDFLTNILVEAHGVLGDLLIFGVIISLYDAIRRNNEKAKDEDRERQEKIRRYQEEIDDFRGWREKEAVFRIVGNVKRLMKLDVQNISLRNCYLEGGDLSHMAFREASLVRVVMPDTILRNVDFQGCYFTGADLRNTIFEIRKPTHKKTFPYSRLVNCDFSGANLEGASFANVHMENINVLASNLKNLFVSDENWISCLDEISRYYVESHYTLLNHNLYESKIKNRNLKLDWDDTFFLVPKDTDIENLLRNPPKKEFKTQF